MLNYAFHPKKCISSKSGMLYIELLYEYENGKVIIVPNRIIDLNLTNTHDMQRLR